ncbi:hypothetical protein [Cellulomonas wangsupingiae]|uniref:YcxB family protein n=1 Tax=Cellulomonas wangsupingiae TaxID=2968085 RepID=A0ABY5KA99_9CELL|nr:hypothetical protein [Cellulomonas wangsupingiae]MCC2335158.1 hypothetical protein [Cellulomonas wangsupingiae]UUI66693.1 hypothetical protein NP075_08340 [Cellulomonas wangsupingiae]
MTAEPTTASLTVTADLLRAMTRDGTGLLLRLRATVVAWTILAVPLVLGLLLALTGLVDLEVVAPGLVVLSAVAIAMSLSARQSVSRGLRVALAPGTTVSAAVADDALFSTSALGSSRTTWAAFRELHVRGSAVVLRLRGSSAFVLLPRALFTDDDLATVAERVGRPAGG